VISKEEYAAVAIVLTVLGFAPYLWLIFVGVVRPHMFSWIIWGLTTFLVFFAQLADGAGAGAWPIGLSGVVSLGIAVWAYRYRADITVTRLDWAFFIAALAALPLWFVGNDPLWAVVVLTTVDVLGLGPTMRKAYDAPYSESQLVFVVFMLRNAVAIAALENYSLTTVLFPAALFGSGVAFIALVAYRRWQLKQTSA